MKRKGKYLAIIASLLMLSGCSKMDDKQVKNNEQNYVFPAEDEKHEGTWLTWPHENTYGKNYKNSIEYIWIAMTKALVAGENVHIIAYDSKAKDDIVELLKKENIAMDKVDFVIAKSDDVWTRDTGPMFTFDKDNNLNIVDFRFDGWGEKMAYKNDDNLPKEVAKEKNINIVNAEDFVLEGGSIELDGKGTAMLTKSSVISKNRNQGMSQEQAENYIKKYLGATNFIWLDGVVDEDITDAHIDGFARFYNDKKLLTVSYDDFFELYEDIKESDYNILKNAKNSNGENYELIELPLTKNNVKGLKYRGSYLNFYVANEVVLVPIYDDINDEKALSKIRELYPNKQVIGINVVPLYKNGGMIHCVTQQQPQARK